MEPEWGNLEGRTIESKRIGQKRFGRKKILQNEFGSNNVLSPKLFGRHKFLVQNNSVLICSDMS